MATKIKIATENSKALVIYKDSKGNIEFRADVKKDTIWATQAQIADVFNVDVRTVNEHLVDIFNSAELAKKSIVRNFRIVKTEGQIKKLAICSNME